MTARVALVLVSHAAAAASGVAEIAGQMAPDVTVLPAGGHEDGLGASVDRVLAALETAVTGDGEGGGVVVLTDLGSAVMTAEVALEMLDEPAAARVRLPRAPFLEGAVAAAVEAQQGADVDTVARAASAAATLFAPAPPAGTTPAAGPTAGSVEASGTDASTPGVTPSTEDVVQVEVTLAPGVGLHARPAALLARAAAGLAASVRVDGADATSVLELMSLNAAGGRTVTVTASGEGAAEAVRVVTAMLEEREPGS